MYLRYFCLEAHTSRNKNRIRFSRLKFPLARTIIEQDQSSISFSDRSLNEISFCHIVDKNKKVLPDKKFFAKSDMQATEFLKYLSIYFWHTFTLLHNFLY